MKQEIRDALALELTKAKMALPSTRIDNTSAYDWVKTYLESEKQILEVTYKFELKQNTSLKRR